jgi:putative drug exporter of the RND superfamily
VLQRMAAWCYRRRRSVVVLWIVALVAVSAIGSNVGSSFSQGFDLSDTESARAAALLETRFPARAGDEGQIVFAHDASRGGVQDAALQARMEQLFAEVAEVPGVTAVVSPYGPDSARQVARSGDIAYATVQFDHQASKIPDSTIEHLRSLKDDAAGDGLRIALGGRMFQEPGGIGPAELIGILAAIVILLVAFGSLLAMGLPILVALFGIGIGLGLVQLLSHTIATPDFATQLASMIGIGVGIDYALFIVTRYRQGLEEGLQPEHAVVRAIDTAGRAVVFAGTTVVISLLGLFLMGVDFVNGMALGTSVTVAVVMLASITLLPALLGFAGRTIDRLSVRPRKEPKPLEQTMWYRWSRVVQRRPWPAAIGGLAFLLLLAIPLLSMRLAFPDAGGNPEADTSRQAYDLVAEGFGAGSNGPLVLAAEFPKRRDTQALDELATRLQQTPDVAAVVGPTPSPSGDAAVIRVIPKSSPQSVATTDLVAHLRDDVIPAALRGSDVQVHVGGLTASSIDVSERLAARLPIFIGAVLVLSFLLLMAVFRSLLVPLKAVIMNLLSIGAAYGVVVAVFEWGWGNGILGVEQTGPIAPFIPMMMFAILFGLSMDYEVFLLSRIREEYDRTGDNALAVADGLASTARVITAAALIMVCVFGSFILGDATTVKLFGLGLATAILVDATVVRMVLVPATMELLGDRNWWFPRWLDRLIPRLHVEAGPDVDAELARLTEEQSSRVG